MAVSELLSKVKSSVNAERSAPVGEDEGVMEWEDPETAYTDPAGNSYAYVTGITDANDFPTTGNAVQPQSGKGGDHAFFTILAFN